MLKNVMVRWLIGKKKNPPYRKRTSSLKRFYELVMSLIFFKVVVFPVLLFCYAVVHLMIFITFWFYIVVIQACTCVLYMTTKCSKQNFWFCILAKSITH